jgi:hypothetical protein
MFASTQKLATERVYNYHVLAKVSPLIAKFDVFYYNFLYKTKITERVRQTHFWQQLVFQAQNLAFSLVL